MAKYSNGQTYREGNDNLNEHQFSAHEYGRTSGASYSGLKGPQTETRTTTRQGRGEKGGKWKKKGRKRVGH
jgi:hypothetical protein